MLLRHFVLKISESTNLEARAPLAGVAWIQSCLILGLECSGGSFDQAIVYYDQDERQCSIGGWMEEETWYGRDIETGRYFSPILNQNFRCKCFTKPPLCETLRL